jgi:hypothetical protein
MKKIKYIVVHSSDNEEHKIEIKDKFSRTANAIMNAPGYLEYIKKHGYHFTDKLADYASKKMVNASGSAHSWTTEQLRSVLGPFTPTHNETCGDMAYTANMAYADFYPAVLDTVDKCVTYAKLVASDPDGYEGMEFMRWTSDAIGKSLTLNWEDFI